MYNSWSRRQIIGTLHWSTKFTCALLKGKCPSAFRGSLLLCPWGPRRWGDGPPRGRCSTPPRPTTPWPNGPSHGPMDGNAFVSCNFLVVPNTVAHTEPTPYDHIKQAKPSLIPIPHTLCLQSRTSCELLQTANEEFWPHPRLLP